MKNKMLQLMPSGSNLSIYKRVDYLKYDNCYNQNISGKIRYPKMQKALNETNRPIFYSICSWG
jgi:hypothetical protein